MGEFVFASYAAHATFAMSYCINPAKTWRHPITGASIQYLGQLQVRCLPKGSVYELTLSDASLTAKELAEMAREQGRKALEKSVIQMRADFERKAQPALIER